MAAGGNNQNLSITIGANMDPSGVLGAVKQMQGAFNGLKLPSNMTGDVLKNFSKLTESLSKFEKLASQDHFSKADVKSLQKLQKEIDSTFGELKGSLTDLSGQKFYLEADYTKIKEARQAVDELKTDIQNKLNSIKIDFNSAKGGTASLGLDTLLNRMEQGVKTSKTLTSAMSEIGNSIRTGNLSAASEQFTQMISKAKGLKGASAELLDTFKQWGLIDFSGPASNIKSMEERGRLLNQVFDKLAPIFSKDGEAIGQLSKELTTATDKVKDLEKIGTENYNNSIANSISKTEELGAAAKQTGQSTTEMAEGMRRASDEVKQLQQSTQYFFSLRNMINLLKRGIREAVDVVKELDAAMTETAVVTDYSVGDMWQKLPEYTANANALGATVKDMYEATTLYYQQGLRTEAAMGIANETMKMARIGGLEAADATDKMTAALRGFNMEINETSAQRVNDVYSNLAAKTASDTKELGTAMQRTASIAASAGMSFEGTAAFLAQAIETTREPAENLGTAMKTIVARFTELKKNPLEIAEVDGEEVSYNKVDTALQSIGVSLKDANGQFRDLDQVFLDISQRWDSLTQTQQRYVATTAAGSRQQSRFIAMMSNYERTMQLMDYANNSAGASNEQFGKTMESLEAKLNKLKNAWNEFLMNIMNDSWTKGIVDGGTKILNVVNNIIEALSFGGKAKGIKSALSLFTAFTALKATGRFANKAIGGLGGLIDPQSSFKEGFKGGALGSKNIAQAKAISQPIVSSLSKISGQIAAIAKRQGIKEAGQKGNTAGVKETSKEDYINTKKLFSQLSSKEGFKIGEASNLFGKLDEKHQLSMFNNNPGTKQAMKQASMNWFGGLGLSKALEKEGKGYISSIYKGMQQGQIPVDKGIELIGQPQKWGQYFGTDMAKGFSSSFARESTQQAHQQAMQYLVGNPNAYGFRSNEFKDWYNNQATDAQKEAYAKYFKQAIDKKQGHGEAKGVVSDMGRFANDIGAVADRFTQAGYGISAFGSLLAQLGGPIGTVGVGIQNLGSIVSSVGMSISAATGLFGLFTEGIVTAEGAVLVAGSTIAAVAAPIAALGAALFLAHKHIQNIKKAGEEVTTSFQETGKTAEDNIAKLKNYQTELATFSKGVDSNGNNINLDDSQYSRYLEIVDDIAKINPEIVEGYNAQGHAIINNNTALAETLKKQQQIKKEAYDTYTSEKSLQKLINARNVNNDFKQISIAGETPGVYDGSGHGSEGRQKPIGLGKDVASIADRLRLLQGFDESSLQKYGIESMDALISGEEQAVKNFIKHRQQIESELNNSGLELNDAILNGFEKLGEDADAFDAAIQPVYDNLLANVSNSKVFESIAPEFREALNMGLKDLASQDLSAGEMAKAANNMAARFANLTTGSGKYKEALDIVEEAQTNFANTLNETQYHADVQPAIDDLTRLKEAALDEGTAYGNALAEYLDNQIQKISRFTEEGTVSLTEALNGAIDDLAAAEAAVENFNESTKTDYYTAAEGMKSVYDKATETFKDTLGSEIEKHFEGNGDKTAWEAGRTLFGEDALKGLDASELRKKFKEWEPALREGEEGWYHFWDKITSNSKLMESLNAIEGVHWDEDDFYIPEDKWSEVAKTIGISEEMLTAMLNKGRQFANIDFANWGQVREALATDGSAIKGTSSKDGKNTLYVKESAFEAALSDAGFTPEQYDAQKKKAKEQNIDLLKPAEEYKKGSKELAKKFNDMGVKTLPDLIKTLNDTGQFTKDEIKGYADKLGMTGSDEIFASTYDDIISAMENPEIAKQTAIQQDINNKLSLLTDTRNAQQHKQANEDFKDMLYGKKGEMDTAFQKFSLGQNEKGEKLSAGEYAETRKNMLEMSATAKEQAEKYKIMAENAKGTADYDTYAKLAKSYENGANWIDKWIEAGTKAYEKDAEIREKEKSSRDEGKKQEQDAAKKAADKKKKEDAEKIKQDQEKGKKQTDYEANKPKTEFDAKAAKDTGKKIEEQQRKQKELEEANKKRWEEDNKRGKALSDAENQRKKDNLKQQQALQKQGEIEGQKLKQKYENELQANRRKALKEQTEAEGAQLTARAQKQKEAQDKALIESKNKGKEQQYALSTKQETQNISSIEQQAQFLLQKSIDTSLKNAINGLDATQIAQDPAQSQAFSNLYADLINNRLPNPQDLDTLGIFTQLSSQLQDKITNDYQSAFDEVGKADLNIGADITQSFLAVGEFFQSAYNTIAQTDKAAAAIDIADNDIIGKSITTLGERLKGWWDQINGIKTNTTQGSSTPSPQKTIEREQTKGQTRTEQLKTIFSSEGAEDVEQKEDEVKEKADKGAEHTTKFKAEDTGVENKLKKLGENKTSSVTVKATADTGGIDAAAKKSIAKPVTIDDKATPKIRQIDTAARKPITKKINVSPNYTGTWHKDFIINVKKRGGNDGAYTGLNNKISFHHVPQAGSLAAGTKKGKVGPKNQGGLTLTGEQGYEIAWLPSESKSAILGANGPQMVDLPKDAVVYNHDQSKEILKRKGILGGSLSTGASGTYNGSDRYGSSNSGGGGGGGTTAKTVGKTANHVKKKATEAAAAIKKVSVWWENIARKTEVAQRAQDSNQKAFEKYLKEMRATLRLTGESLESGGGGGDDYLTSIGKTLGYYEAQLEKVNKELNNLANGTAPADQKKRKEKYGEEGYENIAQISYKKGKKNKEELVDLAKYIKEEDGTFVIDQAALDAISSKEQRKAIADAANKEIDDRLSKKYKAEDEIEKAQEAIEKMGEELYETFFKWENELTKIWNITQKIEQTEARISQFKGYSDLLESQLSTGMAQAGKDFAKQSLNAFKAGLQQQTEQISLSFEALDQKKTDLNKLISLDDEKETLLNIQEKLVKNIDDQNNITQLQEELANKQAIVNEIEQKITKGETALKDIDADIAKTEPKTKKGSKKSKKKAQKKLNTLKTDRADTVEKIGEYEAQKATATADYEAAKKAYEEAKANVTLNDTQRIGYEEYAKQLENNIAMQARAWDFMSAKQLADGTLDVKFDSDAFETEKLAGNITEEQGKQIQDYVKSIVDGSKELTQQYTDTTSLINDMYGSLNNLQDAWAGYAEELWQISDEQQRKEVDNAKKLSDSITNSLKNLLDEVKRKLDERRKQEDNAKTERDISQKQQRLAALRADTAGGHQVEIAQLQQEIADAQQSYQRSLEDQLLDKLQQQADLAAQQREQQIALQEATISEINNAAQVNQWMNNPEEYKDKIYKAFCEANDYDKKPEALQKQLDTKFETLFNGLLTNQEEQQLVAENISLLEGKAEEVRAELEQFTALEGAINQLANVIGQLNNSNIAQDVTKPTGLTTEQTTASQIATAQTTPNTTPTSSEPTPINDPAKKAYEEIIAAAHKKKTVDKSTFVDAVNKGKAIGYDVAKVARDLAEGDGKGGVTWDETVKAAKKAGYAKSVVAKWSTDAYLAKAIKKWSKFKTGGLADYTGPAWLDGTPSKPELVLNSTDTKNFLALRDVLSSAMNSMNTVSNSYGGDTLYEININVDKIEKDYDVDRVVEKVKKEITKGAGYRNVTQVRNLR